MSTADEREQYLAGALDTGATLKLKIKPDDRYAIGYTVYPALQFTRYETETAVFDALAAYCDERGVSYQRIGRSDRDSVRFVVSGSDNVEGLLAPLRGQFRQQREQVAAMLDEVVPTLRAGDGLTRRELYELMDAVELLRETNHGRASYKYTKSFFAEEWAEELGLEAADDRGRGAATAE